VAAENYKAVIAVKARLGVRMATEIHVANSKSGAFEQWIKSAKNLVRDVLENKKLFHASEAN